MKIVVHQVLEPDGTPSSQFNAYLEGAPAVNKSGDSAQEAVYKINLIFWFYFRNVS